MLEQQTVIFEENFFQRPDTFSNREIRKIVYFRCFENTGIIEERSLHKNTNCLLNFLVRRPDKTLLILKRQRRDCHHRSEVFQQHENRILPPANDERDLNKMLFQQDGAEY